MCHVRSDLTSHPIRHTERVRNPTKRIYDMLRYTSVGNAVDRITWEMEKGKYEMQK